MLHAPHFVTVWPQETHWSSLFLVLLGKKICSIVFPFEQNLMKKTKISLQVSCCKSYMVQRNGTGFINYIQRRLFITRISSKIILIVKPLCQFSRNIEKNLVCQRLRMQIHMKHGHNIFNMVCKEKGCSKRDLTVSYPVNPQGGLLVNKAAPCSRKNSGQESGALSLEDVYGVTTTLQVLDKLYIVKKLAPGHTTGVQTPEVRSWCHSLNHYNILPPTKTISGKSHSVLTSKFQLNYISSKSLFQV